MISGWPRSRGLDWGCRSCPAKEGMVLGDNSWHRLPGAELMPLNSALKAPVAAWPVHSTGTVGLKILCKSP